MTQAEIQAIARAAGFNERTAPIASAIAMAESGGNRFAHNSRPPDDSYGLWQINMIGRLGPERRAQFGLRSNDELFDPATNARAAYAISSHGANFRPWTTYTHGTYKKYLTQGQAAAGQQRPASDGGQSTGLPETVPPSESSESGAALPPALLLAVAALGVGLALMG